jgi:DNA-binding SARP family transcriptional activator/predicted ATPase
MTTKLQLILFGKPKIAIDGTPIEKFRYQKSLALLAYLAVTGKPHSRETLAGLLWGESTEANARVSLRKSLTELRALVAGHLLIERHQIAFNREAAYSLDVSDFDAHTGRHRGRAGAGLHPEEAAALGRALNGYQGDFLTGFYVHRAAAFEEWVSLQRERYHLAAIRGLHTLTNHYLTQGQYDQAIEQVERLLALEPTQEEAHRQLISLQALSGQRLTALRQYQACRQVLQAELGIEPQPETTALYQRIRDQESPKNQPTNPRLPVPLTPLIGRQEEIAQIISRLADPACRLLTIHGPGGSGKTHLAIEVASRLTKSAANLSAETPPREAPFQNTSCQDAQFRDGITFIPLNPLRDLSALPSALMHYLGFHFDKDAPPLIQLQEQLTHQRRLIILDNFEHLLTPTLPLTGGTEGEVGALTRLLQFAPGVKFLVTSRVRLNIQGEHIIPLNGIAFPRDGDDQPSDTAAFPAVELFIQRARQVNPTFQPNSASQIPITQICQQVGGLPLGILLAAGWSQVLTPTEIAEQLAADRSWVNAGETHTGIDFLKTGSADLPAHHRSLQAVFAYSWNLLTPQERAALAALSIFPDSFSRSAAQEIGAAQLQDIAVLVDHSLLQRDAAGRYQLHELLRQYARREITDHQALRTRYCAYYTAQLSTWAAAVRGDGQVAAIEALDLEIDNARLAWDWVVAQGNLAQIDQAIDGLCLYYDWYQRYSEGYAACEVLIQHLESAINHDQSNVNRMLAKALVWQTFFAPTDQNDALLHRAQTYLDEPATDPTTSRWERAFCLFQLARIISASGDTETSFEMYTRSIELYESLGDRWSLANVLTHLGELLWSLSAYEEAAEILDRNLTIYRELRDQRGMATAMAWLGTILLSQGKLEGEQLLKESLALYAGLGRRVSMTDGFYQAIAALHISGRYAEAHALLEEKNAQEKGNGLRQDITHTLLADTLIFLGEYDAARIYIQTGLELARRWGDVFILGISLVDNGWLALADGAYDSACRWFQEAVNHCQEHDLKEPLSWALSFLGFTYWQLDQPEPATKNFIQALENAAEIESFLGIVFSLVSGIPLIAELCSKELALRCYAATSCYPAISNAKIFDDLIGEQIAAIKADLPPELVTQAEARGRNEKLDDIAEEVFESVTVLSKGTISHFLHKIKMKLYGRAKYSFG